MAKLTSGIFGPFFGKIGAIIGSSWKDISYIKARPEKKKKKVARTAAQLSNEKKFRFIQQWLVPFYPYITVGFSKLAEDKTEINAAYSANYKRVFNGEWPDITVDYSKLQTSIGDLPGLHHVTIERTEPTRLELAWETGADRRASFDDQLMLVIYCPPLESTDGFIGGIKRNALSCGFSFDAEMAQYPVEVYLSVTSSSRKSISDSIYLGRMEP